MARPRARNICLRRRPPRPRRRRAGLLRRVDEGRSGCLPRRDRRQRRDPLRAEREDPERRGSALRQEGLRRRGRRQRVRPEEAQVRDVVARDANLVVSRIDLPLPNGDTITQAEFFELRDGKITRLDSYYDTARFIAALPAVLLEKLKNAFGMYAPRAELVSSCTGRHTHAPSRRCRDSLRRPGEDGREPHRAHPRFAQSYRGSSARPRRGAIARSCSRSSTAAFRLRRSKKPSS